MTRATCLCVVTWLAGPAGLPAQRDAVARRHEDAVARRHDATLHVDAEPDVQRATWRRVTVRYGKWLTAATAVTMTWMGAREHARSADSWDALLGICRANNADCTLGPNGRYLNSTAERHYGTSVHYDRRARTRLLAGQGALLVTVGLFILDLRHGKDGPENIPFPSLEVTADAPAGGARVGVRFSF